MPIGPHQGRRAAGRCRWAFVAVVADFKSGKSHLWDRLNLRPWVADPELIGESDAIVALKGHATLKQWGAIP